MDSDILLQFWSLGFWAAGHIHTAPAIEFRLSLYARDKFLVTPNCRGGLTMARDNDLFANEMVIRYLKKMISRTTAFSLVGNFSDYNNRQDNYEAP